MGYQLAIRCIDVPNEHVDMLHDMTERAREIAFKTFARHVEWKEIAEHMGYVTRSGVKGLRLSADYAVSFYRSFWNGAPCYYMVHSAIEFVFLKRGEAFMPEGPWG